MGQKQSSISGLFSEKYKEKFILTGLDNAGKTTLLYKLNLGEPKIIIPTIGITLESIEYKNIEIISCDISRFSNRMLSRFYCNDITALIYVLDSNDIDRYKNEDDLDDLLNLIKLEQLKSVPLLVICNKQDLPNSRSISELSKMLDLYNLNSSRKWYLQPATINLNLGITEGFQWLANTLEQIREEESKKCTTTTDSTNNKVLTE